ncbi:helix-turn-helix domain-containing protein [Luteolibacter soli]|uniref:helix-turn-helix domain-containing protein n=1 Tax=Luteolibacter soli TaxID=3135280 RepID=UPI0035C8B53A
MTRRAFISAALDDAGLSPEAFRVWCHMERRGDLWGSVRGIAEHCGIGHHKVREALAWLAANGWAIADKRKGQTTVYRACHPYMKDDGTPSKNGTGPLPKQERHPFQNRKTKVFPQKDTPTHAKTNFRKL